MLVWVPRSPRDDGPGAPLFGRPPRGAGHCHPLVLATRQYERIGPVPRLLCATATMEGAARCSRLLFGGWRRCESPSRDGGRLVLVPSERLTGSARQTLESRNRERASP